jgi:WD40 repeat protein
MWIALLFTKRNFLLSGSYDDTIRLWNLGDYQCVKIIDHKKLAVMLLLPNGYFAANSGNDITMYDLNDFKCVNTLVGHKDVISCMLFIKDNRIVTSSKDKTIILWGY